MQLLRAIEFVKALEKESHEKPVRFWEQVYHVIRKQSTNAGFELVRNLSKELLGKELTHEEIIGAMDYIEAKKKLSALVSSELYREYSPYLYTVREFGHFIVEDERDFKGLEKSISQWQKKQIDQAHVYIALFVNRWFAEDAIALNFEESLSLVEHYMKTYMKTAKNYAIVYKFRTYKGFDTMESILDYIERYSESSALILHKQAEGARMEIEMEKDMDYKDVVYIGYWQETWNGLDVDGVRVWIDFERLKSFFGTQGKTAEYLEYLFKEKDYVCELWKETKKRLGKNKERFREVRLDVSISAEEHDVFIDIRAFPPSFGFKLYKLIKDFTKRVEQSRLTPKNFLVLDTLQNMWQVRL